MELQFTKCFYHILNMYFKYFIYILTMYFLFSLWIIKFIPSIDLKIFTITASFLLYIASKMSG